jgi:beta-glucanase (GH16 family)
MRLGRRRGLARLASLGLAMTSLTLAVALTGPPASATGRAVAPIPRPPRGMHLAFADTFAGAALNPTRWDTCYPWANTGAGCTNFGNPELEWDLPSQVQVANNALHLVASRVPTAGTTRAGAPMTYSWRSGMVTTNHSFEFTYGYVAVRARVPKGFGFWSAFYLLPQSQQWPPEIDIAEAYGAETTAMSVTLHPIGGDQYPHIVQTPDLSAGFHTYAVDWEPGSITWFFDGRPVDRYIGERSPSEPMYFVADLALAPVFGVPPSAALPPTASLDIQSVAIYQH